MVVAAVAVVVAADASPPQQSLGATSWRNVDTFRVWLAVNTCASLRVTFRLSLPVGSFGRRQPCSPVRQRQCPCLLKASGQ